MDVIPAINCHLGRNDCAEDALRQAEKFPGCLWIHLDIADGKFTFNKTWGSPKELARLAPKFPQFKWEIHLMVEEPGKHVEDWILAGASRPIVHVEAIGGAEIKKIWQFAEKRDVEVVLASNPETPAEVLKPHMGKFYQHLVLAVHPGFAGQKFLPVALEKIRFLRHELPNVKIEVDGGINVRTGKLAKAAGADAVIAASYVFGSDDPEHAYIELKKSLNSY